MHSVFLFGFNKSRYIYRCEKLIRFSLRLFSEDKHLRNPSSTESKIDSSKKTLKDDSDEQILFEYPKPKMKYPSLSDKSFLQIVKDDIDAFKKFFHDPVNNKFKKTIPEEFEFLIIGAGPIGSSIAYWLRRIGGSSATVLVIDKDLSFNRFYIENTEVKNILALSTGHLKQKYSLKENIELSKFGWEFLRTMEHGLQHDKDFSNISYKPFGCLTLATKKGVENLKNIYENNVKAGVHCEIFTSYQLNQRFPWLSTDNIEKGLHGLQNEGWIDPYECLLKFRTLAIKAGVIYQQAEILEFLYDKPVEGTYFPGFEYGHYYPTNKVMIKLPDGSFKKIHFGMCILAVGAETQQFAKETFHLNKRYKGLFHYEIPVTKRKRYIYLFESPDGGPNISSPMIIDPTGLYVRREGPLNTYICSCPPLPEEEPNTDTLDIDPNYFTERVWPLLVSRIPTFEKLHLISSFARYEEQNTFDDCPIVGQHPAYHNLIVAAGFGDNSFHHAPGIGRAIAELIFDGYYKSIDLKRFSFHRVIQEVPLFEKIII